MGLGAVRIFILNSRNHKVGLASKPGFYRGIVAASRLLRATAIVSANSPGHSAPVNSEVVRLDKQAVLAVL